MIDSDFFKGKALQVPDDSLGFLLWRATHAWQRRLDQALAPVGLTHLRFAMLVALGWLTKSGEDVSQRELADFLNVHPMQVSQVLGALEKGGMIDRSQSIKDKRVRRLELTTLGEAALRSAMPVVESAHYNFFDGSDADVSSLRMILSALPR